jgi:hypothetical protein
MPGTLLYSTGACEVYAVIIGIAIFLYGLTRPTAQPLSKIVKVTLCVVLLWEVGWNIDVAITSWRAHQLCNARGGLHIYKTVETDGFIGDAWLPWFDYGFEYTEISHSP